MRVARTTIRRKLTAAIMLTSTTAVVLTGAVLVAREAISLRQLLATELSTRAGVLAANCTASLAFRNPEDATQVLAALRADPGVIAAALYDDRGRLFATYPEGAAPPLVPSTPGKPGQRSDRGRLAVVQAVVEGTQPLGTLFLATDLSELYQRVRVHSLFVALAVMGSISVAFGLSTWLQRRIAEPVRYLADAARAVSEHKDYGVRAKMVSDDEIGVLAEAFNVMLAEGASPREPPSSKPQTASSKRSRIRSRTTCGRPSGPSTASARRCSRTAARPLGKPERVTSIGCVAPRGRWVS